MVQRKQNNNDEIQSTAENLKPQLLTQGFLNALLNKFGLG